YRGRQWAKPTRGPLNMTLDQVDAVPPAMDHRGPVYFEARDLRATIDPRKLENRTLLRSAILSLLMIAYARPERPFYFPRTSGAYAVAPGLGDNVPTQGLTAKLIMTAAKPSRDTVAIRGDGWFDTSRTRALWDSVYGGPAAVIAKGDWIDEPSAGIPFMYV